MTVPDPEPLYNKEERLERWLNRCYAKAALWQLGDLTLPQAVGDLQAQAVRWGLVDWLGQDAVQAHMAQYFAAVREEAGDDR